MYRHSIPIRHGGGRRRWLVSLAAALVCGPAAAQALDPPQQFLVRGHGTLQVAGPRCCGDTRFSAGFEAALQVDSAGGVQLVRFDLDVADADVSFPGFLGLYTLRVPLRCAELHLSAPASGTIAAPGRLAFDAGSLELAGSAAHDRLSDDNCAAPALALAGANPEPLELRHDPAGDSFGFDAAFDAAIDGELHRLRLVAQGRYTNRPPVAALGLFTPESPQGGCPAFWRYHEQQWELVAEANRAAGLKVELRSLSWDPDAAFGGGGVVSERWFDTRDGGPLKLLGDTRQLGALTFAFGPQHRVELLVGDAQGAQAAAQCSFRVVDSTPPVVTAPPALTLACTQAGGASPATSGALADFLAGASASDVVDPAPQALPPTWGGVAIDAATLFPPDGVEHPVHFAFRDAWGNDGVAESSVRVVDDQPPQAALALWPPVLPMDYGYHWITASLAGADKCGGPVAFELESIVSNAPALDLGDVLDTDWGFDDRGFYLFARPPQPGLPRVYTVTYRTRDVRGNLGHVSTTLVVD